MHLNARNRTRLLVILVGLVVVGVPTVFGVFPELAVGISTVPSGGSAGLLPVARAGILVVWVIAAAVASVIAFRAESTRDLVQGLIYDAVNTRLERDGSAAALHVLEELLAPGAEGIATNYRWSVFSTDDQGVLVRRFPAVTGQAVSFTQDTEFLGKSFTTGRFLVSDALALASKASPEQVAYLGSPAILIAAPIRFGESEPLGVLVGTSSVDDGFFADPDADVQQDHLTRVAKLARLVGAVYMARVRGTMGGQ
jgi:hypothetical protein